MQRQGTSEVMILMSGIAPCPNLVCLLGSDRNLGKLFKASKGNAARKQSDDHKSDLLAIEDGPLQ